VSLDKEPPVYFGIQLRVLPNNGLRMDVGILSEKKKILASHSVKVGKGGRGLVEEFLLSGETYIDRIPNSPWWLQGILHILLEKYAKG